MSAWSIDIGNNGYEVAPRSDPGAGQSTTGINASMCKLSSGVDLKCFFLVVCILYISVYINTDNVY